MEIVKLEQGFEMSSGTTGSVTVVRIIWRTCAYSITDGCLNQSSRICLLPTGS